MVSEKIFARFPNIGLSKTYDPRLGHLWPQGYILNKFDSGPLGDATYQISRP